MADAPEKIWAGDDPRSWSWQDERFAANIRQDGLCLIWTGRWMPNGYAQHLGKYVHRLSYEEHVGKILPGLTIDHICRNRACVNPDHLRMLPQGENSLRGSGPTALNKRKTHCANGHSLDGENILIVNRADGRRRKCRVCDRDMKRAYRQSRDAALARIDALKETTNG